MFDRVMKTPMTFLNVLFRYNCLSVCYFLLYHPVLQHSIHLEEILFAEITWYVDSRSWHQGHSREIYSFLQWTHRRCQIFFFLKVFSETSALTNTYYICNCKWAINHTMYLFKKERFWVDICFDCVLNLSWAFIKKIKRNNEKCQAS